MKPELKSHWQRLIELIEQYRNGEVTLVFQDGLPIRVRKIEGKNEDVDLTKEK